MPAIVPIDSTLGISLIGVFIGVFYGILTLQSVCDLDCTAEPLPWQVYTYYQRYPKDRSYLKIVVGVVWSLDTVHTTLIIHMAYVYLVTNFGDYTSIQTSTWSFNIHVLITTIVACVTQVFFVRRCWALDKSKFNTCLSGVILFIAVVQFVFGTLCTALTFRAKEFKNFPQYNWAVVTWLGSAAACDILVSAAIVRSLWMARTGIPDTNSLIIRLIMWTVNTGIITSVTAILDITLFTVSGGTLIHIFFNLILAKLYPNTLLATLNHRRPQDDNVEIYSRKDISLARFSHPRQMETDTKEVQDGPESPRTLSEVPVDESV